MKQHVQYNPIETYTCIGTEVLEDVNSLSNSTRWDHEVFFFFFKTYIINKYYFYNTVYF